MRRADATPRRLEVGVELPPLTRAPDRAQLSKFAACGGDFNALHSDPDFAQARAIGDNIDRRFKYAAPAQLLIGLGWPTTGSCAERSLSIAASDRRGDIFTCHGRIVGLSEHDGSQIVEPDLWTENVEGERSTVGAAEALLAR